VTEGQLSCNPAAINRAPRHFGSGVRAVAEPGKGYLVASVSQRCSTWQQWVLRVKERQMPQVTTDDEVKLHYEEAGDGTPVIFVHEFAGDIRSWEPQMRYFSRRYRAVAYNARGYPPSDVPSQADKYSQQRACDDIRALMDGLGIDVAHIVGLSMGGFATLHFGFSPANPSPPVRISSLG
jgi:triacylglycerol esterase/lipase EstA (alpha/beta hydrolase family)